MSARTPRIPSAPSLPGNCAFLSRGCGAILLLSAVAIALFGTASQSLAEEPDLNSIRASAEAYAAGIRTLRGRYSYRKHWLPAFKSNANTMRHELGRDLTFTVDVRQGWTRFDDRISFLRGPAKAELEITDHEIYTYNGRQVFKLSHTHVASPIEEGAPRDVPHVLTISLNAPINPGYKPWEFAGLPFPRLAASLAIVLSEPGIQILKNEEVEGVDCVHLKTANGLGEFWLDPTHDFLPLRAHFGRMSSNLGNMSAPSSGKERPVEELTVLEFRRFRAVGNPKGEFWFPVHGQITTWGGMIHDIVVTDFEINPEIGPGDFMIDEMSLPSGVKVADGSTGLSTNVRYTGEDSDAWVARDESLKREDEEIQKRVAEAVAQFGLPPSGNSPAATAPSPGFLDQINSSAALAAAAVLALVAFFAVILKSRAKRMTRPE